MNPRPQQNRLPAPAPRVTISTPVEARKLAEELMDVMSALLGVIEARRPNWFAPARCARRCGWRKKSPRCHGATWSAVEHLKRRKNIWRWPVSPECATLASPSRHFRAMLQINLTVLATAHAGIEGIVRGVNTEIKRNIPNTYTAPDTRAAPARAT